MTHAVTLISSILWRMVFISSNTLNKPAATSNLFLLSSNCSHSDCQKFDTSSHLKCMHTCTHGNSDAPNCIISHLIYLTAQSSQPHRIAFIIFIMYQFYVHMILHGIYIPFHDPFFAMIIF